jgi:hypothetical protein
MTTFALTKLYHSQVKKFFTTTAEQVAKESQFVRRNRKISGSLFLQALVWTAYKYSVITLPTLAATAEHLDPDCDATEQAFDLKFTPEATAFVQAMFALALHMSTVHPTIVLPLLSSFSAIYILDSSTVSLPESLKEHFVGCGGNASEAATKIYLLLDWLTGGYEVIEIREGRKADQDMGQSFIYGRACGALWLFDLGFWDLSFLSDIAQAQSYFLCRLQPSVALSVIDTADSVERFDLDSFLQLIPNIIPFEVHVLLGATRNLPCRLICRRVPPDVANKRRRRAHQAAQRKGRTPKQEYLNRLEWTLLVTNAPPELIPTSTAEAVYRVRWQIELTFKLAKSEAGLDKTNSQKPERVLCELYAKLIALVLFERLVALIPRTMDYTISLTKAWRQLGEKVQSWGRKLRQKAGLDQLIEIIEYLCRRTRGSKRRKYPSTVGRLALAARQAKNSYLRDPVGYMRLRSQGNEVEVSDFSVCLLMSQYAEVA